jgi:hypothetical protein
MDGCNETNPLYCARLCANAGSIQDCKPERSGGWRFDVPKSKVVAAGRNVIIGLDYKDAFKYRVDQDAPLPE